VDRNPIGEVTATATIVVALLAEGVDRNTPEDMEYIYTNLSPSSRRAWIEIRNTP